MVENDHCLRSGESLRAAIDTVDQATDSAAAHFMVNGAHPVGFGPALADEEWVAPDSDRRTSA